jgi:hypothetical protein
VSNFQLAFQDDSQWVEVAGRRRGQVLAAHQHTLDQDAFSRSAASSAVASTPGADAAAAAAATAAAMAAAADASADAESSGGLVSHSGDNSFVSTSQRSSIAGGEPSYSSCSHALPSDELIALLLRLKDCTDTRQCRAADLLLPELKVTTAEAKLMQAELYKQRVWELKTE